MFIVTSARYNKHSKKFIAEGSPKLWVMPPTLFNTEKKAREYFESFEKSMSRSTEFIQAHKDPKDPDYVVLEFTNEIICVRITEDSPED